jgi:DNA polymerase-1
MSKNPLFIIDGLNLAYRCHHSHAELRTTSDLASGMFFGFLSNVISLKKRFKAYDFAVAWDNRSKRKFETQPDYKAGRSRLPESVYSQVKDLKLALASTFVSQYDAEDEEADDVIATLCELHKNERSVCILTNDKDMLQLVENGKVVVIKPKVGNSEERFFDEEAVKNFFGVPPSLVSEYLSFTGDTTDNIKGVPRLQKKTIVQLLDKYRSLEQILENAQAEKNLTEGSRTNILNSQIRLANNIKIIKLRRDLSGIRKKTPEYSEATLQIFLDKYEIKRITPSSFEDAFSVNTNMRYSDPKSVKAIETYSLF